MFTHQFISTPARFIRLVPALAASAVAVWLAGCSTTKPLPPPAVPVATPAPVVVTPAPQAQAPRVEEPTPSYQSRAQTPRDYRADAAKHLYGLNGNRIYKGMMPPLLYAVGVLQVDVNRQGQVTDVRWMRAPSHAPEVMAEIERTVRGAAPYPAPVAMGRVTYTDTWLWDRSGRFQLDTLTEGQLGEMPAKRKAEAPVKTNQVAKKQTGSASQVAANN